MLFVAWNLMQFCSAIIDGGGRTWENQVITINPQEAAGKLPRLPTWLRQRLEPMKTEVRW